MSTARAGGCTGWARPPKHAVEALSDSLRNEVADFGVRVVLVEPGPVRTTRFGATYVANLRPVSRTYETFRRESAEYSEAIYTGSRRTLAGSFAIQPDDVARRVARVVAKGVRGGRARARYPVGQSPPTRPGHQGAAADGVSPVRLGAGDRV
ncbi:hypothetical protein [Streptomyces sp. DSM 41534]